MKITILTYGSRGDVQPFIPLSLGLMAHGHTVKLTAPNRFRNLIEERGISFAPLAGDPAELSRKLNDSGQNFVRLLRELVKHAIEIGADVLKQTEEACQDADLIIHTFMHAVGGHTLAREMNIPDVHIQFFPMFTPTGDYPNVTLPDLRIRTLNRFTHDVSRSLTVWAAKIGFEQVRRRVGLAKRQLFSPFDNDLSRPLTPILCAWSPSVLPASNDWTSNVRITGYLSGDEDDFFQPSGDLKKFLDDGAPPVCVSFGSMINQNAEKIDSTVRESLEQTNNRGIILSGWSKVQNEFSDKIYYIDAVPHQWLLPRCKMIIHHGGAGTTSAGLRAGIPNIVIPFAADQLFWGRRVHAIGAGPEPILVRKVSTENLSGVILEAEDSIIRRHASVISEKLRSEDGVHKAINLIENYSNEFHTR